ncbi:MAG: TetR/AcrR family transcriptional regulator [Gammaproteobacteria bacterium]|jgi:AcrR family transcriptional regulator|nr:TetR/AcrR family transcriptional regulator [Gammaproteobacteria bacterium]
MSQRPAGPASGREITYHRELVGSLADVFREHGYPGASLARLTGRTGLGKGSLYHLFPDGKAQMATVVLDQIAAWFEGNVFQPLRDGADPAASIARMFRAVDHFFQSGRRICLPGAFALDGTRDRFAGRVHAYFGDWIQALTSALRRGGMPLREARENAEDTVAGIQGALVLARSRDDPEVFVQALKRMQRRLAPAEKSGAIASGEPTQAS